jgi:hypothetical protein
MSQKHDENSDELILSVEELFEEMVEQGPTPSIAPMVGSSQEVVDHYTHCPICCSRLHFTYNTDYTRNTTQECSTCPECGVEAKQVLHRLQ